MAEGLATVPEALPGDKWLHAWHDCLAIRERGLVPADEQVFIFFGQPITRPGDSWRLHLPADFAAIRLAPMAITAGIDATVYFSGDSSSYGLLSSLAKRLLDCGPRRLQLIDTDAARCALLRLAVSNGY